MTKSKTPTTTTQPTAPPPPQTLNDTLPLPKLLVFDLDYTLWPFWIDTHITPPLKLRAAGGSITDRYAHPCAFYPDVPTLLPQLSNRGLRLAAASRTSAPRLARELLSLLPTSESGKKAIDWFEFLEIYPGSKLAHFQRLREKSGVGFEEMLFFDDEARNREVEKLGVTMFLVQDGVGRAEIDRGVELWRERNGRFEKGGE